MDEQQILQRIHALVDEEHDLLSRRESAGPEQHARITHLEETLDQCWDLLRRRRARRSAGLDPDDAQVAPVSQVEGYLQ
ncbi:unnamed protein product [[Actinomadura] parvosata subsp. kistnae]|uniref:DUF2630 domain-containing protein n=1 Tax=[Actinomadura] parvosata subsp. kistnae TaxID=1909395 RepID=A0A1U9ZTH9_9ACTN|nr:DUF2630 family protein [Nonomuraea sp. ATCC 55076]AQZ61242.1 hypothetical protein BKM31_06860 [Nonomuraea sp. ATCC 55076]SPL97882.1 unnamed protein product [Actinomadura parvosata subsp. kistnae]